MAATENTHNELPRRSVIHTGETVVTGGRLYEFDWFAELDRRKENAVIVFPGIGLPEDELARSLAERSLVGADYVHVRYRQPYIEEDQVLAAIRTLQNHGVTWVSSFAYSFGGVPAIRFASMLSQFPDIHLSRMIFSAPIFSKQSMLGYFVQINRILTRIPPGRALRLCVKMAQAATPGARLSQHAESGLLDRELMLAQLQAVPDVPQFKIPEGTPCTYIQLLGDHIVDHPANLAILPPDTPVHTLQSARTYSGHVPQDQEEYIDTIISSLAKPAL